MQVALLYNLKEDEEAEKPPPTPDYYAECDSIETVQAIADALSVFHEVTLIEANADAFEFLRQSNVDIVFNIAEGTNGIARESQMPAILEMLGIPYTGSNPLTLAICLDKARTKEILSYHKIPTPRFQVFNSYSAKLVDLEFPLIVKPVREGSSKGINNHSVAYSYKELKELVTKCVGLYQQPALVEEFIIGREFTCALLGNLPNLEILPIVEMKFDALPKEAVPIYSYEAKWVWDTPDKPLNIFECPAKISHSLKMEIEATCRKTWEVLDIKDWCRIDLRLDSNGVLNVIEVNPLPGILPRPEDNSCFPKAARAKGMSYTDLINAVLNISAKRWRLSDIKYQKSKSKM
ncbi:MAG: ATP-grasp domain-containing protein [bacterium]|nr:ATP-grasp domain-containing protein [bacterium]